MNLTLHETHEDFRQSFPTGGDEAFQSRYERNGLEHFGSEPQGSDSCLHRTRGVSRKRLQISSRAQTSHTGFAMQECGIFPLATQSNATLQRIA